MVVQYLLFSNDKNVDPTNLVLKQDILHQKCLLINVSNSNHIFHNMLSFGNIKKDDFIIEFFSEDNVCSLDNCIAKKIHFLSDMNTFDMLLSLDGEYESLIKWFISVNYFEALQNYQHLVKSLSLKTDLMFYAVSKNVSIDVINFLIDMDCKCTIDSIVEAIKIKQLDMAKMIIDHNPSENIIHESLNWLSIEKQKDLFKYVLENYKIDSRYYHKSLFYWMHNKDEEMMYELLCRIDIKEFLKKKNVSNYVVQSNSLNVVKTFVEHGLQFSPYIYMWLNNDSKSENIARYLIELGIDYRSYIDRLLRICIISGTFGQLEYLINLGVSQKNINEAFLTAISEDKFELIEYLISMGADVNYKNTTTATYTNNIDILKYLIEKGADIITGGSNNVINHAIGSHQSDFCRCLLENGAIITLDNRDELMVIYRELTNGCSYEDDDYEDFEHLSNSDLRNLIHEEIMEGPSY
ncbi:hypothetical protein qu_611 [Acanthamoeba polyphaga mimivirus]|nr:hypothetical protein [Mimivirus reunion]WMV61945.1 hypothetical protein qu_611 [Mimivirus sp.]WMV62922.1 hypothetical protein qu_611 [Acanthamoeba polyphaga mimivirus]WMV63899.1 hypothetical protein qu_611 [Mimivirus sp.]